MTASFETVRARALALLNMSHFKGSTRRSGSFLGQCCVDPTLLSEAQESWMNTLLERNSLPPLDGGVQ